MQDQQLLERIACNPKVMAGKPVIRGTRLTVEYILNLRAWRFRGRDPDRVQGSVIGGYSSLLSVRGQTAAIDRAVNDPSGERLRR